MEAAASSVSGGGGGAPAPFLLKTYDMVDDAATDELVSWTPAGTSFVVRSPTELARDLLPRYFKHNNFSSFVRQLNTYGFRKIDPDQWEFANEYFIRGRRHLLQHIHRRKPVHSHSPAAAHPNALQAEAERHALEEEIDRLKHDKNALLTSFQMQAQQQHALEEQIGSLEDRLISIEQRQRLLLSSLRQTLERHGYAASFELLDLSSRKRRLLKPNSYDSNEGAERRDGLLAQAAAVDANEPFRNMESSLISLEKLFRDASNMSGEDLLYEDIVNCPPLALTGIPILMDDFGPSSELAESAACYADDDTIDIKSLPSPKELPTKPVASSVAEATENSDVDSEENNNSGNGMPAIDMNSTPTADQDSPRENDVFWKQFMMEVPGSADRQDLPSEVPNANLGMHENAVAAGKGKMSRDLFDRLTERMGHLFSAEKA